MAQSRNLIVPGTPEWAPKAKTRRRAIANEKANDSQWQMIDSAIGAWIKKFPLHWMQFQQELNMGRNIYNDAKEGDLRKAQWRNTAAFPVAYSIDKLTGLPREDSLLLVLQKIIPGLTHKNSKNYAEFLKRYPQFMPSDRTNHSTYI